VQQAKVVIIGAGIVGLATALEFVRRYPGVRIVVLEKEPEVAQHQTSHNSGVIHSGIYYKTGSLKAKLCRAGSQQMHDFCREYGLPLKVVGKVIVATRENELPKLDELFQRGVANGIAGLKMLEPEQLREIEPHSCGIKAIHVPGVAITAFGEVAKQMATLVRQAGGEIVCGAPVEELREETDAVIVKTAVGEISAAYVVNCAGLQSDYVARMAGGRDEVRIVPFRGEYYELAPEKSSLINGLIYPVPDPRFPFLGVHFTRRVDGSVEAGPNAVFAFRRNGYRKTDFSAGDLYDSLSYPGFWNMAAKHWKSAIGEYYRSFSKRAFVASLRRLVPELDSKDLRPGGSGVRAQALRRDGALVDDFQFEESARIMHVYNVPSPAATASLAIGQELVLRIASKMALPSSALLPV
jgi:L-2-hydroxyglutarate oxidase LhgO